jgi:hypothetical protein
MKSNILLELAKAKAVFQQRAILAVMGVEEEDCEPTPICKVTGTYCTGSFCDEYGCAKEAGFND